MLTALLVFAVMAAFIVAPAGVYLDHGVNLYAAYARVGAAVFARVGRVLPRSQSVRALLGLAVLAVLVVLVCWLDQGCF